MLYRQGAVSRGFTDASSLAQLPSDCDVDLAQRGTADPAPSSNNDSQRGRE